MTSQRNYKNTILDLVSSSEEDTTDYAALE